MAEIRALEIKSSSEWGFNEKKLVKMFVWGLFRETLIKTKEDCIEFTEVD